jgi:hypothetical protein
MGKYFPPSELDYGISKIYFSKIFQRYQKSNDIREQGKVFPGRCVFGKQKKFYRMPLPEATSWGIVVRDIMKI